MKSNQEKIEDLSKALYEKKELDNTVNALKNKQMVGVKIIIKHPDSSLGTYEHELPSFSIKDYLNIIGTSIDNQIANRKQRIDRATIKLVSDAD